MSRYENELVDLTAACKICIGLHLRKITDFLKMISNLNAQIHS